MSEKEFDREVRRQLLRRARIVKDTQAEVRRLLARALEKILATLADQPSDYQQWILPTLATEVGRIAADLGDAAVAKVTQAANAAWQAGSDLVTEPLAQLGSEGAVKVAAIAPRLDTRQLLAMQHFLADRMMDVSLKAANAINTQLGLVVIGAQNPFEAQVAIKAILKESSALRAATIVRTELLRVYSTASHQSLAAAAEAGVAMDKVWRRSGKAHPRISHALADGQRVAWDQPFLVGGQKMMHPHDPKAPAKEVINCGCVMVPKPRDWTATVPDHKPFTAKELARNPTLAAIVGERDKPAMRPAATIIGDVPESFRAAVDAGMASIPARVRQAVAEAGYTVAGGRTLIDIAPRLGASSPRGAPDWATWEHVDAATLGPERIIAVAQECILVDGRVVATSAARIGALLRHEYAHVLDGLIGASADARFVAAYRADAADLRQWLGRLGDNAAAKGDIKYLLQAGAAGRQEAFADLFAELYGGGTASAINVAIAMPTTLAEVRRLMEDFLR